MVKLSAKYSQEVVAKMLGRSPSSVKGKRTRMNIEPFSGQTDRIALAEVARMIGVDRGTISRTWVQHGLKTRKNGRFKMVTYENLADFMENNPKLWQASKCDYYFFCQYKWFMDRLADERRGRGVIATQQTKKYWSEYEISRLKLLRKRGLSNSEIGKELGRTKQSVDHMFMRLNRSEKNVV